MGRVSGERGKGKGKRKEKGKGRFGKRISGGNRGYGGGVGDTGGKRGDGPRGEA